LILAPSKLRDLVGEKGLPQFLINFIEIMSEDDQAISLAIHTSSSIAGYGDSADQVAISRKKGFIGKPQLEVAKFPDAMHHLKIFYNKENKGKVFYKYLNKVNFIENHVQY